jgi:ubiquinone/menaquinone biosynthesis C-methylase UbiE
MMYLLYGKEAKNVMSFKDKAWAMSEAELSALYDQYYTTPMSKRPTALNKPCLKYILNNLHRDNSGGGTVLDAACGTGFLLKRVKEAHPDLVCSGIDFVEPAQDDTPPEQQFKYIKGDLINMPFDDNAFDTVLCTHALEHVTEYKAAIQELIRITKRRLIIVVPCQREYKYTPDYHINFFPYLYNLKQFIGIHKNINAFYQKLGNDFLCDIQKQGANSGQ